MELRCYAFPVVFRNFLVLSAMSVGFLKGVLRNS